jgi:PAS domain S-box-containing protein
MDSQLFYEETEQQARHIEEKNFQDKPSGEELSRNKEFFEDILENQTELICRCHADGAITYANDAYCCYFGKTLEELMGHSFMSFVPEEDREIVDRHVASLTVENPVAAVEHRVLLPSGEVRWQQWIDRAIFDERGHLVGFQSVGRDFTERILAEKRLQKSEKRYRSLISKMGNGFALNEIIFDKDGKPSDCLFLEVNPAFEEMTGLNTNDIVGKKAREVFPGTESFWVDKCGQVILNGTPVHFKNCSKLFDRHFEIIAYSPGKCQVATVFTDITERMKIEAALRESESNFRAIAENANDGILIAVGEGLYVYANWQAIEISEYSIDELNNMSFKDLAHPDQIERISQIYHRRITGKPVPACYETIIIKKSGGIIPIEVTGSKTIWHGQPAVMIIIRDISMRKRLEAALGKINNDLEQRVTERTQELMGVAEKLEENQKELLRHKLDLEKANKELVQTNTALSVLARNIDKKRDEVEKKIARTISSQILPIVDEIKNDKMLEKTRAKLDVLAAYLNDLTPAAAKSHDIIISLSPMELRVAMMIKNGFSSEEIARLLHISPHTVKTHRRSIRKKLNIKNANINLASYLKLKLGKASNNSNLNI